ncbi:hypothetical protein Micbo1qcDRAFT_171472 [Microdochium bolleyi]|uniref:Uncharacterized protein n=1 Tax=Microdochium bolleyi TaxID=196109 RepID=A0A136JD10_9PEZI|nr:hypothetical protein Micbo1qcDRAFT_171472 [Microdochium bolleyi]
MARRACRSRRALACRACVPWTIGMVPGCARGRMRRHVRAGTRSSEPKQASRQAAAQAGWQASKEELVALESAATPWERRLSFSNPALVTEFWPHRESKFEIHGTGNPGRQMGKLFHGTGPSIKGYFRVLGQASPKNDKDHRIARGIVPPNQGSQRKQASNQGRHTPGPRAPSLELKRSETCISRRTTQAHARLHRGSRCAIAGTRPLAVGATAGQQGPAWDVHSRQAEVLDEIGS